MKSNDWWDTELKFPKKQRSKFIRLTIDRKPIYIRPSMGDTVVVSQAVQGGSFVTVRDTVYHVEESDAKVLELLRQYYDMGWVEQ